MYTLAVRRNFIAQHFLVGGDWGPENIRHSHHYVLEVQLEGAALNRHGYLVDIVAVEGSLNRLVHDYTDKTLNDLPKFQGLNPSIEHFTRIAAECLAGELEAPNVSALTVRIWENDIAWAACRLSLPFKA